MQSLAPLSNRFATAQTATVMLLWLSPAGRFVDASDPACRALGHSREELLTRAIWDIDPSFSLDCWPDHWRALLHAKALRFQTTLCRRDGSPMPVEVSVHYVELAGNEYLCMVIDSRAPPWPTETALRESEERLALAAPSARFDLDSTPFPVKDANGQITHVVAYHLNITDLKAAETKLRHHLDLEQAVAEISGLMIRCDWQDFDTCVNWTLGRIGRLTQADRSYLFTLAPDGLTVSNTHEWCAPGSIPASRICKTGQSPTTGLCTTHCAATRSSSFKPPMCRRRPPSRRSCCKATSGR